MSKATNLSIFILAAFVVLRTIFASAQVCANEWPENSPLAKYAAEPDRISIGVEMFLPPASIGTYYDINKAPMEKDPLRYATDPAYLKPGLNVNLIAVTDYTCEVNNCKAIRILRALKTACKELNHAVEVTEPNLLTDLLRYKKPEERKDMAAEMKFFESRYRHQIKDDVVERGVFKNEDAKIEFKRANDIEEVPYIILSVDYKDPVSLKVTHTVAYRNLGALPFSNDQDGVSTDRMLQDMVSRVRATAVSIPAAKGFGCTPMQSKSAR